MDCPGCGLTRAFHFLLDGEFLSAWQMHPAIYFIALFLFCAAFSFIKTNRSIKVLMFLSLGATLIAELISFTKNFF